jgi:hypothetical protein
MKNVIVELGESQPCSPFLVIFEWSTQLENKIVIVELVNLSPAV